MCVLCSCKSQHQDLASDIIGEYKVDTIWASSRLSVRTDGSCRQTVTSKRYVQPLQKPFPQEDTGTEEIQCAWTVQEAQGDQIKVSISPFILFGPGGRSRSQHFQTVFESNSLYGQTILVDRGAGISYAKTGAGR